MRVGQINKTLTNCNPQKESLDGWFFLFLGIRLSWNDEQMDLSVGIIHGKPRASCGSKTASAPAHSILLAFEDRWPGLRVLTKARRTTRPEGEANDVDNSNHGRGSGDLPELVSQLESGAEIVITQHQQPVAKLVREQPSLRKPRKAGSAKGKLVILQDDKEHLKDFEEYM